MAKKFWGNALGTLSSLSVFTAATPVMAVEMIVRAASGKPHDEGPICKGVSNAVEELGKRAERFGDAHDEKITSAAWHVGESVVKSQLGLDHKHHKHHRS